jgi:hypothetical protein
VHYMMQATRQIEQLALQSNLFTSFNGLPTSAEIQQFNTQVQANLRQVQIYLKTRYVTTAITTALAVVSGGDVPYSFFHGDDPGNNIAAATSHPHCSSFSPLGRSLLLPLESRNHENHNDQVYKLLRGAQPTENGSHPLTIQGHQQTCLVSAFLYHEFGPTRMEEWAVQQCPEEIGNPVVAFSFLQKIPADTVDRIVKALGPFAVTRVQRLQVVVEKLYALQQAQE